MPKNQYEQLQKLQSFAAKVILRKTIYDHVTPCLFELHWLLVRFRVDFKIALLTFKCLNGLATKYLIDLIEVHVLSRALRSSSSIFLKQKTTKFKTLGDRSFSFSAPSVWNTLPFYLRSETSVDIFKKNLITYYFRQAFSFYVFQSNIFSSFIYVQNIYNSCIYFICSYAIVSA